MATELVKCAFVVEKRGRRCRMVAAKGSAYCGEHLVHDKHHQRHRIPCPLDPSHTIYEDQLARHQRKCNASKKPRPSCYRHGINSGLVDGPPLKEELLPLSAYSDERIQELITRVEKTYDTHVSTGTIPSYPSSHPSLASELCDPNNGPAALKHLIQQSSILGHLHALHSLIGEDVMYVEFGSGRGKLSQSIHRALQFNMDTQSCEPCRKRVKISSPEGCTSHSPWRTGFEHPLDEQRIGDVASADSANRPSDSAGRNSTPEEEVTHPTLSNVHFLLVDRTSCRRKVDGSLRTSSLIGVHYHRLLMDIEHLDLSRVDGLGGGGPTSSLVAVGKHLCGGATDLALHCLTNNKLRGGQSPEGSKSSPTLRAVLIALCCHHRCSWTQLAGREFFVDAGFSPVDFHMISHMTSWAVCGVRSDNSVGGRRPPPPVGGSDVPPPSVGGTQPPRHSSKVGYVPHPNEAVGLKCKRLIDVARVHFLKGQGFKCRLVYYVDKQTSLENVLLIAT